MPRFDLAQDLRGAMGPFLVNEHGLLRGKPRRGLTMAEQGARAFRRTAGPAQRAKEEPEQEPEQEPKGEPAPREAKEEPKEEPEFTPMAMVKQEAMTPEPMPTVIEPVAKKEPEPTPAAKEEPEPTPTVIEPAEASLEYDIF